MTREPASGPARIKPDLAEIRRSLDILYCALPGDVIEIRGLHCGPRRDFTVAGYFDSGHLVEAAQQAAGLSERADGVYVPINRINPTLLARAANRLVDRPQATTADADIVRRLKLLCDLDPRRASGVSATDAEKELARQRAEALREHLADQGWVAPVFADSGNGYHLVYPIDLPNDVASRLLLERVLKALALTFSDAAVALDCTVFNASRIVKLYGTVARKGDNTVDRPHRLSRILEDPR